MKTQTVAAVVPTGTFIQEVGQQAAHDRLVADDQHVLLSLHLHDDGLHPLHQVLVGLQRQAQLDFPFLTFF